VETPASPQTEEAMEVGDSTSTENEVIMECEPFPQREPRTGAGKEPARYSPKPMTSAESDRLEVAQEQLNNHE